MCKWNSCIYIKLICLCVCICRIFVKLISKVWAKCKRNWISYMYNFTQIKLIIIENVFITIYIKFVSMIIWSNLDKSAWWALLILLYSKSLSNYKFIKIKLNNYSAIIQTLIAIYNFEKILLTERLVLSFRQSKICSFSIILKYHKLLC